jgi:hypothetical protein
MPQSLTHCIPTGTGQPATQKLCTGNFSVASTSARECISSQNPVVRAQLQGIRSVRWSPAPIFNWSTAGDSEIGSSPKSGPSFIRFGRRPCRAYFCTYFCSILNEIYRTRTESCQWGFFEVVRGGVLIRWGDMKLQAMFNSFLVTGDGGNWIYHMKLNLQKLLRIRQ